MTTSAHAGDQVVNAVGEVGEDFLSGCVAMYLHVGRVGKLHGHPAVGIFADQLSGLFDAAAHAQLFGSQHQLSTQCRHVFAAFDGHGFGHGEDQAIAFDGTHHGEGNAGITGGGLNDDSLLVDQALLFRILDHCQANTVLDAGTWIGTFRLHPYFNVGREQAVDTYTGSVADRLKDTVVFHGGSVVCC